MMAFTVAMKRVIEAKIKRLAQEPPQSMAAKAFWKHLATVMKVLSETPVESGEILYHHQHVNLKEFTAVFGPLAVQYAVDEQNHGVVVTRLTITGKHSYPPEFEETMNQD